MLNLSSTGASSCSRLTFISLDRAVQPRDAVVDLENRLAARLQHAPAFVDEPLRASGVLDDAVRVDEVEGAVRERQTLPVGDLEVGRAGPAARNWPGQVDGRRGEVDAGHDRAALGEPRQVDAGAAADLENRSPAIAVKVDEPKQVMQLLEMILVEIVEEPARAYRVSRETSRSWMCAIPVVARPPIVATADTIAVGCPSHDPRPRSC